MYICIYKQIGPLIIPYLTVEPFPFRNCLCESHAICCNIIQNHRKHAKDLHTSTPTPLIYRIQKGGGAFQWL